MLENVTDLPRANVLAAGLETIRTFPKRVPVAADGFLPEAAEGEKRHRDPVLLFRHLWLPFFWLRFSPFPMLTVTRGEPPLSTPAAERILAQDRVRPPTAPVPQGPPWGRCLEAQQACLRWRQ